MLSRMMISAVAIMVTAILAACSGDSELVPEPAPDILETARQAGSFDTLVTAVEAAGLADVLTGEGPFTVFAPSDAAFASLPAGTVESLLEPENIGKLTGILTYHVVPGRLEAQQVISSSSLSTAFGQPLQIAAGASVTIGNDTSSATITETDIPAGNGVIHVIDRVMLPMDIVDLAASVGVFNTLLAAAQAAGLESVLRGDGPLTVFAPTDEAFANLPAGTVESLLEPENMDTLVRILTYHVAGGTYTSAELAGYSSLEMISGDTAQVSISSSGATIDEAMIVEADLMAGNGIVHVISEVILPPM